MDKPVLSSHLFQLGHYTVADARYAFSVETVHHGLDHLEFVLEGEIDEIRIDDYMIWGSKGLVVGKEERGGDLRNVADFQFLCLLFGKFELLLVFGKTSVF